jgi:hypothetical protein
VDAPRGKWRLRGIATYKLSGCRWTTKWTVKYEMSGGGGCLHYSALVSACLRLFPPPPPPDRKADSHADSQIHNQADSKRIIERIAGRVVEYELDGGSAAELPGENG